MQPVEDPHVAISRRFPLAARIAPGRYAPRD
jgi:hypothetical protein